MVIEPVSTRVQVLVQVQIVQPHLLLREQILLHALVPGISTHTDVWYLMPVHYKLKYKNACIGFYAIKRGIPAQLNKFFALVHLKV